MRHHKGPKQKTAQAQKTPTARGERRPQHSFPAAPTGGFTTIDTPPRRVAGVSHPYGRNSPHTPTHNRHPRPAQTPIAYDLARTQQPHATPARPSAAPPPRLGHANGGFTTIDTSPRRVAGVSQPYGRNSPHAPTHNRQPRARATTQHPAHPAPRPYTTSPPQHSQTPPRLGHANGGFYYHRHPATACRRRVTALWSQIPPRAHPQPPTLRPSNNTAPRTPRATPTHNLTTAAFADATSTPPAPIGEPKLRAYPYADSLPSAPCPTATATPPTPTTEPEL